MNQSGLNSPEEIPKYSNRQVVYATLTVVAALLLFLLLYRFNQILIILLVALVLATAISPVVKWLSRRGISRPVGVSIVYFLLIFFTAGFIVLLLPLLSDQIGSITRSLPGYYTNFRQGLIGSTSYIVQQLALQLPDEIPFLNLGAKAGAGAQPGAGPQLGGILPLGLAAQTLIGVIAVFVLGFYWILEGDRYILTVLLWVPSDRRESIRELVADIEAKLGGFILGQGLLCLVVGVLALIAYLIIGLPYAFVLAVVAGILEAVPIFGPVLGAIPATMIALSIGLPQALQVVAASTVIQELENHLLVPRVMKRSVGVNSLVTLLALLAFTSLLGLMGAMLAIPIAAVIQLFIDRFVLTPLQTEVQTSEGRDQLSRLRYEAQELTLDVRKQMRENENIDGAEQGVVDALEAIAIELDELLSQSEGTEEQA